MRKFFTKATFHSLFILTAVLMLAYGQKAMAQQPLQAGMTYYVNGQNNTVGTPLDTFPSLMGPSGIITCLNTYGVDSTNTLRQPITIILTTGYTGIEPAPIAIGNTTGGYPAMRDSTVSITLKPLSGLSFSITTNAAITTNGSLLRFNSIRWFTIDGTGPNGERNLSFVMPSTATINTTKVIDLNPSGSTASGIQYITIKNCNIIGASSTTAINTFAGIYVGGVTATPSSPSRGRNSFISFINNQILSTQNGIYYRGFNASGSAQQDNSITIRGNIIGGYSFPSITPAVAAIGAMNLANTGGGNTSTMNGIYINTVKNSVVDGNTIRNTYAPQTSGYRGIYLNNEGGSSGVSLDSNIQVTNNQIYSLVARLTGNAAPTVTGIRINLGQHTTPQAILLANNSIAGLLHTNSTNGYSTMNYTIGIGIDDNTANAGYEIYYNSINLNRDTAMLSSYSACFATATTVTGGIIMMNNVLSNTMGTGFNTTLCINASTTATSPFTFSSFNNYYCTNIKGGVNSIGIRAGSKYYMTLKTYRLDQVSDSTSISAIPPFTNDSICYVNNGVSHRMYNRAVALDQYYRFNSNLYNQMKFKVTTDINGTVRNNMGRFSAMGCHLWNGDSTSFPIALFGGGNYKIDNTFNPPTLLNPASGSFRNFTDLANWLNSYGINAGSGNIKVNFTNAYTGEPGYIPVMGDYQGALFATPVVVSVDPGVSVNLTLPLPTVTPVPNFASVLRFAGTNYVTIDGTSSRSISMSIPSADSSTIAKVVTISTFDATSPKGLTIQNCVLTGSSIPSKIYTAAGIYVGKLITINPSTAFEQQTDEKIGNLTFYNNVIQGVRSGIRILVSGNSTGTASASNIIRSNIIGGNIAPGGTANTTYLGSIADQAGIYVKGMSSTVVDSNIIRNCVSTTNISSGFRGIDIDEATLMSANLTVSRNMIYNLNTTTGTYCAGIRMYLGTTTTARSLSIENNFISNIGGAPTVAYGVANPVGILIDAATSQSNVSLSVYHNTVNLNLPVPGAAPGGTSCIYIGTNLKTSATGGMSMVNNLFVNTGNRLASATTTYKTCVVTNGAPFVASDKNDYYIGGIGGGTLYYQNSTPVTGCKNIFDVRVLSKFDQSSFNQAVSFVSDTLPDPVALTSGLVFANGNVIPNICKDIYNNPRAGCPGFNIATGVTNRCVGAVEFNRFNSPLVGGSTYYINGIENPPMLTNPTSGSFASVRSAANYLNLNGVDQAIGGSKTINLVITNGYVGENDTFTSPISFLDYPNMDPTRPVVLGVDNGRFDTIRVNNAKVPVGLKNTSLILMSGCKFVTIDGNNQSPLRGLTFMMPAALNDTSNRVVDVVSGVSPISTYDSSASWVSIRNCNIVGVSTPTAIKTFAGIYMGGIDVVSNTNNARYGQNSNNTFDNNYVQAVRYGFYLRGVGNNLYPDQNNVISNNEIGGKVPPGGTANTTYFGGFAKSAGILINAQRSAQIINNKIHNNLPAFADPRGIEVATFPNANASLKNFNFGINTKIDANVIYNITSTVAGSGAAGILVNFNNDTTNLGRNLSISNNRISRIVAPGSTITSSTITSNPYGILIDATTKISSGVNAFTGINIYFNTVNLGPANSMTATNGASAALAISSNIRGGINVANNIFQNRLGNASGTSSCYGVMLGGSTIPFNFCNNNNYYAKAGVSSRNGNVGINAQVTPVAANRWDSIYVLTGHDSLTTYFFAPFDQQDTILTFFNTPMNNFVGQGINIYGFSLDALGTPRNAIRPCIGAHEVNGSYIDSMAPRIFSSVQLSQCYSNIIPLNFIVSDRFWTSDTLYYSINGQAEQFTNSLSVTGNSRTYLLTNVPNGAVIRYRLSANDFSGNNSAYPYFKQYDTVTTNISAFPLVKDFEGANNPIWSVENVSGNGNWTYTYGSVINPPLAANSGIKTAMFNSAAYPAGTSTRLVSPCLDFTNMKRPAIRFYMSQSADVAAKNDILEVETSVGGGYFTKQTFSRVNTDFAFPGWKLYEVCLDGFDGLTGVKVSFKATAAGGGQNILLDDIQIFDDYQNSAITPKTFYACFRDSASFTIKNTTARDYYTSYLLDKGTAVTTFSGNGSDLIFKLAPNNSADTVQYYVKATNAFSGCNNVLNDTVTVYNTRFYNGPFIMPVIGQFDGAYNDGSLIFPDGAKVGDVLTYSIKAPAFYKNSDYGTIWGVPTVTAVTTGSGTPAQNVFFMPPNGSTNAYFRIIPQAGELDSTFKVTFTLRYLNTGCDSVITRYLRITTQPNAIISTNLLNPVDTVCALSNAIFSSIALNSPSAGPYSYVWNFGDGSTAGTQTVTKAYLKGGQNYTVRLTVGNYFGVTGTVTKTIYVRPSPSVDFTYNMPCNPDSTMFDAGSQPAGTVFNWTMPDGSRINTQKAKYLFPTIDSTYEVSLSVTNSYGCKASKTIGGIYVFAKPKADFTVSNHCLGTAVGLVNKSTMVNGTPGSIWSFGNGDTRLGSSPVYKYPTSGTYTIKLISRSNFGCSDSTTKIVTVYSAPKADFNVTYACTQDPTNFTNNSSFSGGINNVTFTWNFGDNSPVYNGQTPNKVFSGISDSDNPYMVTLYAEENNNHCRDSVTKPVIVSYKPNASFYLASSSVCENSQVQFFNSSFMPDLTGYNSNWKVDGNTITSNSPSYIFGKAGSYPITLIVTAPNSNCSDTATSTLTVTSAPVVTITATNLNNPYGLYHFAPSIPDALSYTWHMGDLSNTLVTTRNVDFNYNDKGNYNIRLDIEDKSGCKATAFKQVTVDRSVGVESKLAEKFELSSYPNPFSDVVNVEITLDKSYSVQMILTDVVGKEVMSTDASKLAAGKHIVPVKGTAGLSAGTYMLKIKVDGQEMVQKLIKQ